MAFKEVLSLVAVPRFFTVVIGVGRELCSPSVSLEETIFVFSCGTFDCDGVMRFVEGLGAGWPMLLLGPFLL